MKIFYPGKKFPSLSVTGDRCRLDCPHCQKRFLNGMKDVSRPESLLKVARRLSEEGGDGFLLSGGCDAEGKVPLDGYYEVLDEIKEETDLTINVHTGLPIDEMIEELKDRVDVVSYDLLGSSDTIRDIYGLDRDPDDYRNGYERMREKGLKVVPHITVGLHGGELDGEYNAVDMVEHGSKLIINSLIPGEYGKRVAEEDILSVIRYAREEKDAELILGCMRERGRIEMEKEAVREGITGIVLPAEDTLEWLKEEGYSLDPVERCCAV